jgi:hypothetical protein
MTSFREAEANNPIDPLTDDDDKLVVGFTRENPGGVFGNSGANMALVRKIARRVILNDAGTAFQYQGAAVPEHAAGEVLPATDPDPHLVVIPGGGLSNVGLVFPVEVLDPSTMSGARLRTAKNSASAGGAVYGYIYSWDRKFLDSFVFPLAAASDTQLLNTASGVWLTNPASDLPANFLVWLVASVDVPGNNVVSVDGTSLNAYSGSRHVPGWAIGSVDNGVIQPVTMACLPGSLSDVDNPPATLPELIPVSSMNADNVLAPAFDFYE